MAAIYYRQMVSHGKNHKQALGAVMSHLGARVLKVLLEDRPYELRDINGSSVTRDHARRTDTGKIPSVGRYTESKTAA